MRKTLPYTITNKPSEHEKINTIATIDDNTSIYQNNEIWHTLPTHNYENSTTEIVSSHFIKNELLDYEQKINSLEILVHGIIRKGKISEAKSIINEFTSYSSPLIDKWRAAFSRPEKKELRPASLKKNEIETDSKIIDKYSEKLSSQWIAISEGNLVAHNFDLNSLKKEIKAITLSDNVTFIKL